MENSMEYDDDIKRIASDLSKGDRFLAEELRNEMHLEIIGMVGGQDKGFYLRQAKIRAIAYIRSTKRSRSR